MNLQNFHILLPEIILLALTALLLIVGLFSGRKQSSIAYALTQCTLILTLLSLGWQMHHASTLYALEHMFISNPATTLADAMTLLCAIFSLAYSKSFFTAEPKLTYDYCLLFLFSTLGMLCLISSNHLLPLYLSLELLSLPLFALAAIEQTGSNAEAAMKYFALGALASALLLYGFSLIYGATGSLWLTPIETSHHLMITAAIIFITAGFAYKFGAAPFHLWAPDIYQGAPISVVNFLGSVPKIAALVILIRLFGQTLVDFISHWQAVWIVIALASMALGNIAAIIQTNIRRLFAYSAVAHMGYLLLGIISGTIPGFSAALLYVFAYALMSLAAFGALIVFSNQGFAVENLEDLRGLNNKNPWLAFLLLIVMFSMAGIPPSIGFFAKLAVFQALIGAHLTWLAVCALIFAIIGAYYYIRVVKIMYFEPLEDATPIYTSWFGKTVLSINSLAILLLGIFPNALIEQCDAVFFKHELTIAEQTYP